MRTCAYNLKANGIVERFHRSLKAALKCRGGNWFEQLPIVMLGLRVRPDEDGSSAVARVTGESPLIPHILCDDFNMAELSIKLHNLNFPYRQTRQRETQTFVPKDLHCCCYVWLRVDRVKKALEAPYQGPYRVLNRSPDVFTIEVRGQSETVAIERLKPAVLPSESDGLAW